LGLALASEEDVKAQLLTYMTNKCQLLVFDNFEHLLAGASIITGILQAAPQVRVMITSRAKLNVTSETVVTLAGLETTWDRRLRRSKLAAFNYSSMPPGGSGPDSFSSPLTSTHWRRFFA
jgi:predicted ATPase